MALFAEGVPAAVTVPAPSGLPADAAFHRREEVADDVEETERWVLGKFVQTVVEVLVNGTAARDLRIAEVLYVERQLEIAHDSVATEAEPYARRIARQTAFETGTRVPVPVDTVSDRFAGREEVVDSVGNSAAENEDATMVVAVAALY